jgi:hypothetical protein
MNGFPASFIVADLQAQLISKGVLQDAADGQFGNSPPSKKFLAKLHYKVSLSGTSSIEETILYVEKLCRSRRSFV